MCQLFPLSHHGHELFFDRGGSFQRAQAKRECFMQGITLCNEVLSLFAEPFPLSLKFFHFTRLQCANDVESRLVLKFLKVYLKSSFRNHGAGRFSSSLMINSGTL